MPTGSKIKEIRIKKGLTQKELGERCGIADSNIRKYENEKQNPKIETLQKIADALECDLKDLLKDDDTFKVTANTVIFTDENGGQYKKTENIIELTDRAKYIDCYDNMNKFGKREALKRVTEMTKLEEYTQPPRKLKLEPVTDEELAQMKYIPPANQPSKKE